VLTGVVSVPCRYIHSPNSLLRLDDFQHTISLVRAFVLNAAQVLEACQPAEGAKG
jgi:endoglucanase